MNHSKIQQNKDMEEDSSDVQDGMEGLDSNGARLNMESNHAGDDMDIPSPLVGNDKDHHLCPPPVQIQNENENRKESNVSNDGYAVDGYRTKEGSFSFDNVKQEMKYSISVTKDVVYNDNSTTTTTTSVINTTVASSALPNEDSNDNEADHRASNNKARRRGSSESPLLVIHDDVNGSQHSDGHSHRSLHLNQAKEKTIYMPSDVITTAANNNSNGHHNVIASHTQYKVSASSLSTSATVISQPSSSILLSSSTVTSMKTTPKKSRLSESHDVNELIHSRRPTVYLVNRQSVSSAPGSSSSLSSSSAENVLGSADVEFSEHAGRKNNMSFDRNDVDITAAVTRTTTAVSVATDTAATEWEINHEENNENINGINIQVINNNNSQNQVGIGRLYGNNDADDYDDDDELDVAEDDDEQHLQGFIEFNPYLFMGLLPPYEHAVAFSNSVHQVRGLSSILPRRSSLAPKHSLILDLDETLVHCSIEKIDDYDVIFEVDFGGSSCPVYVRKRPYLQEFLEQMSQLYEITVFTASQKAYAEKMINILDPQGQYIKHRLYRESCLIVGGNYLKDISILGRDLTATVLIDNSPHAFGYQVCFCYYSYPLLVFSFVIFSRSIPYSITLLLSLFACVMNNNNNNKSKKTNKKKSRSPMAFQSQAGMKTDQIQSFVT